MWFLVKYLSVFSIFSLAKVNGEGSVILPGPSFLYALLSSIFVVFNLKFFGAKYLNINGEESARKIFIFDTLE